METIGIQSILKLCATMLQLAPFIMFEVKSTKEGLCTTIVVSRVHLSKVVVHGSSDGTTYIGSVFSPNDRHTICDIIRDYLDSIDMSCSKIYLSVLDKPVKLGFSLVADRDSGDHYSQYTDSFKVSGHMVIDGRFNLTIDIPLWKPQEDSDEHYCIIKDITVSAMEAYKHRTTRTPLISADF